jgi:hypothetical protein
MYCPIMLIFFFLQYLRNVKNLVSSFLCSGGSKETIEVWDPVQLFVSFYGEEFISLPSSKLED